MPNSIFFLGGYAIHGTGYLSSLGRPASHGCVRLAPNNAARLYYLVQRYGLEATRITIAD
jgi:lipoprotein-anchoring transpeptidase ErfK/SrfK